MCGSPGRSEPRDKGMLQHAATTRLDSAGQGEEHCTLSPLATNREQRRFLMTPPPQRKPRTLMERVRIIA
jgi:hypothetical protein